MSLKPIVLYNHAKGPNPRKVRIVLEELGIPYELIDVVDSKEESFLKINPNGRLPAIKDTNNDDFILWESGAIVEYIIETYDKENKLNLTSPKEKALLKQYLHFQMSGQGPYYGQCGWFYYYHPEDLPSAKDRYIEQAVRVMGVLNTILDGKDYLLGDKCTYADLAFVSWDVALLGHFKDVLAKYDISNTYPNFYTWHKRLTARPSVTKVYSS